MNNIKRVTGNLLSILIGESISLILNFVVLVFIARKLGVNSFGLFSYLIALLAIISNLSNLGLGPIVFRELSKDFNNSNILFSGLLIRLVLFFSGVILVNAFSHLINLTQGELFLLNILMLNIILSAKVTNFREILTIPYKTTHKMIIPVSLKIIDNLLLALTIFFFFNTSITLETFVIIYTFSNLPGFIILVYNLFRKFKFSVKKKDIIWLIKQSLPLYGFVLAMAVFQQADLLFLRYLKNDYATGIYSAALRLVTPLTIIPMAFVTTVFPLIVRKLNTENKSIEKILVIVNKSLFFIASSIALIFTFKSSEIINRIFGHQYLESTFVLIWLVWSLVFYFLIYFSFDVFTAHNKQILNLYVILIMLGINIILDVILIPEFSFKGAAISKLFATIIGYTAVFLLSLKLNLQLRVKGFFPYFWLIVTFLVLWLISGMFQLEYYLLISVCVIILLGFFLKFFSDDEVSILIRLFKYS